jgi:RNA polymerase sigma factor (sigma-70 family)
MTSTNDSMKREQLAALLADHEQRGELKTVAELEMSADPDHITEHESESLETESLDARALDQQLATELGRGRLGGSTSSAAQLRELGARPRLPVGTERRLVQAAREGDRRAREELVEAFLPLIAGVARVYRGSASITRVELIQEGVVGLLRALERYDPALGVPFWGYATWWVRQAMQQLIAELTRPTVLSDRALRNLAQLKRAHGDYLQAHGQEPSGSQLAADTGLTHAQVGELLALERIPQSMDEPVQGAEGELGAFGELLADPLAEDAYEQLLDRSEIEQVRALLAASASVSGRYSAPATASTAPSNRYARSVSGSACPASVCARSRTARSASSEPPRPPAPRSTEHRRELDAPAGASYYR